MEEVQQKEEKISRKLATDTKGFQDSWSYGLLGRYLDEWTNINKVIYFSKDVQDVQKCFNRILELYYTGKSFSVEYHTIYLFTVFGVNPDSLKLNILMSMTKRAYMCIFHKFKPYVGRNIYSNTLGKKFRQNNEFYNYVICKERDYANLRKKSRKELVQHIQQSKGVYNNKDIGIKWHTTHYQLKKIIYKELKENTIDYYNQLNNKKQSLKYKNEYDFN